VNIALGNDGMPILVELSREDGRVARFVPQEAAARAVASMAQNPLGRMLGAMVAEAVIAHSAPQRGRLKNTQARKTSAALAFAADAARAYAENLKDAEAVKQVSLAPTGKGSAS
jgi:hypothetical protein